MGENTTQLPNTAVNPENPAVWNDKGKALQALGRSSEAEAAFAEAKKLGGNSS